MDIKEIKSKLCSYDKRNPNNILDDFAQDEPRKPRQDCYCDNCFNGRDKLALIILELIEGDNHGNMAK